MTTVRVEIIRHGPAENTGTYYTRRTYYENGSFRSQESTELEYLTYRLAVMDLVRHGDAPLVAIANTWEEAFGEALAVAERLRAAVDDGGIF